MAADFLSVIDNAIDARASEQYVFEMVPMGLAAMRRTPNVLSGGDVNNCVSASANAGSSRKGVNSPANTRRRWPRTRAKSSVVSSIPIARSKVNVVTGAAMPRSAAMRLPL